MKKLQTIYLDLGVFSQIFDNPQRQNYWWDPKRLGKKWWHGPLLSSCKIWWKSNDGRQRESTECDVFHFFVYNAPQITVAGDIVALLQQEIASVFVGRFRCGLQRFFSGKKSPFQYTRWRYDTCRNAGENFQNLRKWVQSLCAPLLQGVWESDWMVLSHVMRGRRALCVSIQRRSSCIYRNVLPNGNV